MELVTPCRRVRESFLHAVREYQAEGQLLELDHALLDADFEAYLAELAGQANPERVRPPGCVPESTWWYVSDSEFLGRISVRHYLTPKLSRFGGHIGYEVRPSARGRGHATRMLGLALPLAHRLGIDNALLTCDVGNTASRKVIEANGGVLEDSPSDRLRFWISTTASSHEPPATPAYPRRR